MDNKNTAKLINGKYWEIVKNTDSVQPIYNLINTHQKESQPRGATTPTHIKTFLSNSEALYLLNDIDNNLRNVILEIEIDDEISVELKKGVDDNGGHYSGEVTDNSGSLTITGKNQDINIKYSQIKKLEKVKK